MFEIVREPVRVALSRRYETDFNRVSRALYPWEHYIPEAAFAEPRIAIVYRPTLA